MHGPDGGAPDVDALLPLLRALRDPGDEAQFTRVIAAVAGEDPVFAARLAEILVNAAPAGRAVGALPTRLRCRSEVVLRDARGREVGQVDLVFDDEDGEVCLLVELKLHSAYGIAQLPRYLSGLATIEASRKGLLAVTKNTPLTGESEAAGDELWLGSVRWSALYDDLLALAPSPPGLAAAWRASLKLLREQGDFGPMDLDPSLFDAWAKRDAAEQQIRGLLAGLVRPTEEALRDVGGGSAEVLFKGRGQTQAVFAFKNRMMISFAVPAAAREERFRVQFFAWQGEARFTVEARYQHRDERLRDDRAVMAATNALSADGLRYGRDDSGHHWTLSMQASDVLAGAGTTDRMMAPDDL